MNKLFLGITLVSMMLTGGMTTSASSEETSETISTEVKLEVKAGIKPGSLLYGIDKGWEKFVLKFVGDEKETELLLEMAEERLAELNEIDEDEIEKYADELYQEYGSHLDKVNQKLAEKEAKGEADVMIKAKLDRVATLDEAVEDEKVSEVSVEIKVKVNQAQMKAYALSIVTELEQEQVDTLREQGFGYGEIIKLQAFSEVSGKTIEELMFLDIYVETENGEKEIDFGKLAIELGLVIESETGEIKADLDAVKDQLRVYKDELIQLREELKEKAEKDQEAFKLEIEARLEELRAEIKQKVEAKLEIRLNEFNTKIEEIYLAKVTVINNLNEEVLSAEEKDNLIIKLDEVKTELMLEVKSKVESGEISPRDIGKLNAEIHVKFNQVFDEELDEETKEILQENFDNLSNLVKPIFDELVLRFEAKHEVTLTEEQRNVLWLEIEANLEEIEDKEDILEDLDDRLGDLLDQLYEEDSKTTVDVEIIFDNLLNDQMIKSRLTTEAYLEFKQELIDAKQEMIDSIDETQNEFKVRMELYQEFMARLEVYLENHDYVNPNAEQIFDKIVNSTLFRISTRLNHSEFATFKQELLNAKADLLAEVDLSASNIEIELDLTARFMVLLDEYKDSTEEIEVEESQTTVIE